MRVDTIGGARPLVAVLFICLIPLIGEAQELPVGSGQPDREEVGRIFLARIAAASTRVNQWLAGRQLIRLRTEEGRPYAIHDVRRGRPVIRESLDLTAGYTIGAHHLWSGGSLGLALDGGGQLSGVWEYRGWPYVDHPELGDGVGGTRVTVMDESTKAVDTGVSAHATKVTGLIAAGGVDEVDVTGTAPATLVHAYDDSLDVTELYDAALNNGLLVSNHAYGEVAGWWAVRALNDIDTLRVWFGDPLVDDFEEYKFGFYDETSYEWDLLAFTHPQLSLVISAGNDGDDTLNVHHEEPRHWVYTGTGPEDGWEISETQRARDGHPDRYDSILPGMQSAKNVLTIGSIYNADNVICPPFRVPLEVAEYSAWGPTDDGRIKPELVAPGGGVYILQSIPSNPATYACSPRGGTSFSSPVLAGAITLINDLQAGLHVSNPSIPEVRYAATWRALLTATANDLGTPGPDYGYGYGSPNLEQAASVLIEDANAGGNRLVFEDTLGSADTFVRTFISVPSETLSVAIAWTDPPGKSVAHPDRMIPQNQWLDRVDIPMLVNDLDLTVIAPDETTSHYPWALSATSPALGAVRNAANHVDNIEVVDIDAPTAGMYTAVVSHSNTLTYGQQAFSLLVDGAYPCGTHLSLEQGWNLLSFACLPEDSLIAGILPEALEVYEYDGSMTSVSGKFSSGKGYWAKLANPLERSIGSMHAPVSFLDVVDGWNLVGTFDQTVGIGDLDISPGLTLASDFLWYNPDSRILVPAENGMLEPGKAYWIKCEGSGQLTF